jgi:RNA polymerase sigma-70 factor (ECF subfamily)
MLVSGTPDGGGAPGDDLTPPTLLHGPTETVLAALLVLYGSGDDAWGEPAGAPGVGERRAAAQAAICLARTIGALRPDEPEARALLALMLLRHARRDARRGPDGEARTLAEHDRTLWRRDEIAEAHRILEDVLAAGRPGPYLVAAAIAALHDEAPTAAETEWDEILALYDVLAELAPSPRVTLERALARGMAHGIDVGLVALDELEGTPGLEALLPATRAELLRRAPR